jgi:hypothetical protein
VIGEKRIIDEFARDGYAERPDSLPQRDDARRISLAPKSIEAAVRLMDRTEERSAVDNSVIIPARRIGGSVGDNRKAFELPLPSLKAQSADRLRCRRTTYRTCRLTAAIGAWPDR